MGTNIIKNKNKCWLYGKTCGGRKYSHKNLQKRYIHEIVSSFYFPSLMNRPHHQMLGTPHNFMHTLPWRHTPSLSFSFHDKYKYFYNQMKSVQQQNSTANICYNFNTIFKRYHFIYQKLDAIKYKGLLLTVFNFNSNIREHKSYTSTKNQKKV